MLGLAQVEKCFVEVDQVCLLLILVMMYLLLLFDYRIVTKLTVSIVKRKRQNWLALSIDLLGAEC